jgi:WD40 repeat protein
MTQIREIDRILFEDEIYNISYSLEKNILALCLQNGMVHLLDLQTFERLATSKNHNAYIWCSTFTNDGKYLYTGDNSGKINKFEVDKMLNKEEKSSVVHSFQFSMDIRCLLVYKNYVISASSDRLITLTDIETNEPSESFKILNIPCCMKLIEDELFIVTDAGTLVVFNFISNEFRELENGISTKPVWSFIHLYNGIQLFGDDVGQLSCRRNENWENLIISEDRISEMILYEEFLVILSFSGSLLFVDPIDFRVVFQYQENCHFTQLLNYRNRYFITSGVGSKYLFIWYLSFVPQIIQMLKRQKLCDLHFHFS